MIELSRPLGNEKHQARYYLGSCANLKKRFQQHLQGSGAAFTRAAIKRGIFDRLKTKKTYLTKFMNIDDSIINF